MKKQLVETILAGEKIKQVAVVALPGKGKLGIRFQGVQELGVEYMVIEPTDNIPAKVGTTFNVEEDGTVSGIVAPEPAKGAQKKTNTPNFQMQGNC